MKPLTVLTTAAVLGGSICGDHLSPISDTTILSSAGAGCNHVNHVESQMQYGGLVAGTTFLVYLISGFIENSLIGGIAGLLIGVALLLAFVLIAKRHYRGEPGLN